MLDFEPTEEDGGIDREGRGIGGDRFLGGHVIDATEERQATGDDIPAVGHGDFDPRTQ